MFYLSCPPNISLPAPPRYSCNTVYISYTPQKVPRGTTHVLLSRKFIRCFTMECLVWNTLHAKTRYKIPKIFDSSQKLISPIFTAQKVPYAKAELKNISHF